MARPTGGDRLVFPEVFEITEVAEATENKTHRPGASGELSAVSV
jgi:hypothetical protein